MSASVVVVGGINMDLTVWVDRLPRPGETVRGDRLLRHAGGKGANQAVAAARAGARVALIGRVGRDAFGDELLRALLADGVDVSGVARDTDAPTGVAMIVVDAGGQNTITVGAGANARLTSDDLDGLAERIQAGAIGVLNFEVPMAVVLESARRFRSAGAAVMLNCSPLFPIPPELLPLVDTLVVNEVEGAAVAGFEGAPEAMVERFLEMGIPRAALTLGASGVAFGDASGIRLIPGHAVACVDPTAAGDAFLGALAAELARGADLAEACAVANAAGALAVTRAGAQPSLPRRAEIEQLLRSGGAARG